MMIKHTPPLLSDSPLASSAVTRTYVKLNDSSLVFLKTAKIYAELHDTMSFLERINLFPSHVKLGGA